jgi:hypothetical protein
MPDTDNKSTGYDKQDEVKQEVLRWIFSIAGALVAYMLVAVIVMRLYHPDIEALKAEAARLIVLPELAFPKPVESLLFRLAFVTILPSLYGFYFLLSRQNWIVRLTQKPYFLIISAASIVVVATLIYLDFSMLYISNVSRRIPAIADGAAESNFNFFFDGFFIGNYLWAYAFIVVPLVSCFFFTGIKKYNWEYNNIYKVGVPAIGYTVIGAVVLAIIAMNTFSYPYGNDNKFDFNAVYYSMTQVYAGIPLLVDGFTNTYGLYPQFLNILFHFTGLSILKFSLTMSILTGLCFVLNFYVMRKFTANRVILFMGFATMIFFSYLNRKMTTDFDCFFALFPIRYIIPSTLLFLAGMHFTRPVAWLYWGTFFFMAFFVLWNPEIGIICYLSWIVVNIYRDFYNDADKANYKKILAHCLSGIAVLPVVFYLYKAIIYLIYGTAPDMSQLWKTMLIFGKIGFMLLPMPLLNPWNLFALIIVIGFLYAIVKWHRKAVTPRASFILLLCLIASGYFFYYQGRSHNVTLSSSTSFCILLLTMLSDELWYVVKRRNIFALNALFVIVLFLVSFSFIELIFSADRIYAIVNQADNNATEMGDQQQFVESNTSFIMSHTEEQEKIHVLTMSKFQGIYFGGSKRQNAFNPGLIDMQLNSDLRRFEQVIRDSSFSIFMEPELFNYGYTKRISAEVAAMYEMKSANKSMVLLKKRPKMIPVISLFKKSASPVIYRKYTDDTIGAKTRTDDALGIMTAILHPEFSAQVLFYSRPQIYPYSALVGNLDDSAGFVITNMFNSEYYVIIVNDNKLKVTMKYNQWHYCVLNVFTDHADIYTDGQLAGSFALPKPIQKSERNLFIGNLGSNHYFLGPIAEVSVDNTILGQDVIKETWTKIVTTLVK